MTSLIDQPLSALPEIERPVKLIASEQACLRCIAGHMIPASTAFGMPGADDPAIFADMVASVRRDGPALSQTLRAVDDAAGKPFSSLPAGEQIALLTRMRTEQPGLFGVVESVVSRAYYRNDRVLTSIGMEPRAPFPAGFVVEQGDWSLLDPVRKRGAIFRKGG